MKIIEGRRNLELDLPKMRVDNTFTVYESKKKCYVPATWIEKTGLPKTHHCMAYFGCCGSGKTSTMVSIVCSKKKDSRVYYGCYDHIYICAKYSSIRSIGSDPFKSIPEDQFYPEFNVDFIDKMNELCESNSSEGEDTLIVIDDAVNRLKSSKIIQDKLSNLMLCHRHLKVPIHLLCQDICQAPLNIRSNLTGAFIFKQTNEKRVNLVREEYLSQFNPIEYKQVCDYLYRKKGDSLYVDFGPPFRYFRNFQPIEFTDLEKDF